MSKIIGISGSPRKKGNSATLMRAVLKGAADAGAETQEVYLNDLDLNGCQGCTKCSIQGLCIQTDELSPVMAELRQADVWVLASPIYFDNVTGQFKTFLDRCRTFIHEPETHALRPQLSGSRKAVIIATYEDRERADYRMATDVIAKYLAWMGEFDAVEIMCESGLGPADAAAGRPELLARAEELGSKMIEG